MNNGVKIPKCRNEEGWKCFAYFNGCCKCLSDTRKIPCPFFKTKEQVMKEDPNFFKKG